MNGWQIAGCVAGYILGAIVTSAYAEANGDFNSYDGNHQALFVVFWPAGAMWIAYDALADSLRARKRRREEREEESRRMKAAAKKALGEVME